jgi:hypothetical protein
MDIDIDFPVDFQPLDYFSQAVQASRVFKDDLVKHPAGVYLQQIPTDNITGLAAIPYNQAADLGYIKIDFLHLSLLEYFDNKEQIRSLSKIEPDWTLLHNPDNVSKLFQIHRHFNLINKVKPTSVQELADCIALIRPAKRPLVDKYVSLKVKEDRELFRSILYAKPSDGKYHFKKPHAVAYSVTIVLQLHLIKGNII